MKRKVIEKDIDVEQAREKVTSSVMQVLQAIAELEGVIADKLYQDAFNDGVAWVKSEMDRLAGVNTVDETVPLSTDLSPVEKIAKDNILQTIITNPGMRTSDILTKVTALPLKPPIGEDVGKRLINRLARENMIVQNTNRWYSADVKKKLPDYQVMTYMPDGSKYLGSDINR